MFQVKRIYDPPSPGDGTRYLVDRVWPRGVSREKALLAGWLKDLAPTSELRTWFDHDPAKWDEFRRRYQDELAASPEARELAARLRGEGREGTVTLLFAARDEARNNAVALKGFLSGAKA